MELEFELVKYSGKNKDPGPSVSRSNAVVVRFFSSPYVAEKGFSITYHVYNPLATTSARPGEGEKDKALDATGLKYLLSIYHSYHGYAAVGSP